MTILWYLFSIFPLSSVNELLSFVIIYFVKCIIFLIILLLVPGMLCLPLHLPCSAPPSTAFRLAVSVKSATSVLPVHLTLYCWLDSVLRLEPQVNSALAFWLSSDNSLCVLMLYIRYALLSRLDKSDVDITTLAVNLCMELMRKIPV